MIATLLSPVTATYAFELSGDMRMPAGSWPTGTRFHFLEITALQNQQIAAIEIADQRQLSVAA